jgi:Cdc6-like AAA superfamily ATPase
MTQKEIAENIIDWIEGENLWQISLKNSFDKERFDFRKNLLFFLYEYISDKNEEEYKILNKNVNEIRLLVGCTTQRELEEFLKIYIFQTKLKLIEFKITKDTAKLILNKFMRNIPKKLYSKPNFQENNLEKDDIFKAYTKLKNNQVKDYDSRDTDYQVKIDNELYNVKKIFLIALALKNNIEDSYIYGNFYNTQVAKKILENLDFQVYYQNKIIVDEDIEFQLNEKIVKDNVNLLKNQKQIILQGPPGTGKTRLAKQIARKIIKNCINPEVDDIKEQVKLIQFHPSYSYEDFVRGIVADSNNGIITYKTENKVLAQMAKKALKNKSKKYILIIDEINRANLSSVLGELIYALEYRGEAVDSMYEIKEFNENNLLERTREIILPSNLLIIGTMNTADRSIGHIDYAIRRRFTFIDVLPDSNVVSKNSKFNQVRKLFKDDNGKRATTCSPEFNPDDIMLGHSYFIGSNKELKNKLQYQVKPLLKEYIKDGILNNDAKKIIDNL